MQRKLSFTTRWQYDSWGRIRKIVYPDGEEVTCHYDRGVAYRTKSYLKTKTQKTTLNTEQAMCNDIKQRTRLHHQHRNWERNYRD